MSNKPPRITIRELINYILDLINFEKGVPYAMKALFLNPKKALDTYFYDNRHSLVNPLRFMVLGASLLLVLMLADKESMVNKPFSDLEEQMKNDFRDIRKDTTDIDSVKQKNAAYKLGYKMGSGSMHKIKEIKSSDSTITETTQDSLMLTEAPKLSDDEKGTEVADKGQEILTMVIESMNDLLKKYINLISFFALPIVGWFSWIMFRGKGYNYAEHLVVLCFLTAWTTWFMIPFAALEAVVKTPLYLSFILSITLGPIALYYLYKKVFNEGVGQTIIKTLVIYIVQQTTVMVLFILGFAIIFGIKLMAT